MLPLVESLESRQLLATTLTAGAPVDTTRQGGNEVEGLIAINPTNANNIVTVSQTDANGGSQVLVSRSFDGGKSWSMTRIGAAQDHLIANTPRVDTRLAFDGFGNLYVAYMVAASSNEVRVVVARSSNGGSTFNSTVAAVSGTGFDPDSPALATGVDATNSRQQVLYLSFTDYKSGRVKSVFATSSGLGRYSGFSRPQTVSDSFGTYSSVAVNRSGQVAIAWQTDDQGQGTNRIMSDVDLDGPGSRDFGADKFVTTTNVGGWDYIPAQPNRSIDAEPKIAFDNSRGAYRGRLYMVYTEEPRNESNDTEIYLRYSDNLGASWSRPARVNDDATARSQFMPALAVDPATGYIGISWYDARNSKRNNVVQVYATVSTDHGVSVKPNILVSRGYTNQATASYSSSKVGDLDLGDCTGLAFFNGKLMPCWADNTNAAGANPNGTGRSLDLYTAVVTVRG